MNGGRAEDGGSPPFTNDAPGVRRIDYAPETLNPKPSRRYYIWMMAPSIVLLAGISIYPFVWLIYMSLHTFGEAGQPDVWNNFKNFTRFATDG